MPGLFGIIDFNRIRPFNELETFKNSAKTELCDNQLFFSPTPHVFLGLNLRYNTPESHFESINFPEFPHLSITAIARIDNREELSSHFKLKLHGIPDSIYILHAYQKWGENCVSHLIGDYVFAIWDATRQRLWIANSPYNTMTIFYHLKNKVLTYSGKYSHLIHTVGTPVEINQKKVADYMLFAPQSFEDTFYCDYHTLPSGHSLTVSSEHVKLKKFWSIHDIQIPEIKINDLRDYKQIYIDTLQTAIKKRLRSDYNIGADLSSGLDSSAVSAFSAIELAKTNKKLHCFTSYPDPDVIYQKCDKLIYDETELAYSIGQKYCNVIHHKIPQSICNKQFFETFIDLKKHLPLLPLYLVNLPWIIEIVKQASEMDIRTKLSGSGGNLTISKSISRQQNDQQTYWGVIKQSLKRFINEQFTPEPSIISHKMRNKLGLSPILCHELPKWSPENLLDLYQKQRFYVAPLTQFLYSNFGVTILDPTTDINVIKMSLTLMKNLNTQNLEFQGRPIRLFLEDILPTPILENKKRGKQNIGWPTILENTKPLDMRTINPSVLALLDKDYISDQISSINSHNSNFHKLFLHFFTV